MPEAERNGPSIKAVITKAKKKPLPKKMALFIVLFQLRLSLNEQKISSSTGMKIRSSAVPDSSLH